MSAPRPNEDGAQPEVDLVRRRLLLAGGRYVAPAILANLLLAQHASAASCAPPPTCTPTGIPCSPTACSPPGQRN